MKNTLMFLLVSLLLVFSLTACGGGQTNGTAGEYDSNGQTGGTGDSVIGSGASDGAYDRDTYDRDGNSDSLMDDARDAVDDAGRSVRNAVDDAGNSIDRAF